jgi:signal transduction histidine kinase
MAQDKNHPSDRQESDLRLLSELGGSLSAVLNLPELLRKILDATLRLTPGGEARIVLIDGETGHLAIHAATDAGQFSEPQRASVDADPLIGYVIAQRRPLLIHPGDSLGDFGLDQDAPDSRLYVPLNVKDRTTGLLISLARDNAFTPHHRDMLIGLAGYAAIAIENALLYQQALDRTLELSLLVESADAVSSSLDLGRVLNAIARHLMRALQAHWCIISNWDVETERIIRLAEYRLAVWVGGGGPPLTVDTHSVHGKALQMGKPVAVAWDESTDEEARATLDALGCRWLLALPLQHAGQIVGLAELSNIHRSDPLTTPVLGHAMRASLEVTALLRSPSGVHDASRVRDTARKLADASGADWCTLYVGGRSASPLTRLVSYGSGVWLESGGTEFSASYLPTLRIVLREQRIAVLRTTDEGLHPHERAQFQAIGPSAMLALPLAFRGTTVGLVQLFDLNPERTFTGREMGLARALANQAAVALENARLVRDLQRSLEQQAAMQGHLVRAARLSALGELSAMIAHQINNPLTTILGDAELLVQDLPADRPEYASAEAILRAGQRAKQVVEHVLSMARGDEEVRPLNVNDTIRATLTLLGPQITQNGVALDVELADDLPPVRSSSSQLEDVWMNLLINARDAIVQAKTTQGRIRLQSQLGESGRMIEVSVKDNGIGIASNHLERAFDPFFTTKPRGKGTGLGLYICQQVVREHGGKIHLVSAPGDGTLATVLLPAMARVGAAEAKDDGDDLRRG